MDKLTTDILIIGGGPAGISAAIAAAENSKKRVTVVDDNPYLGGQIWRKNLRKTDLPIAEKVIEQVYSKRVDIINSVNIVAQTNQKSLIGEHLRGAFELRFKKLVLATGARERFLPFPGWTLPNVYGAGGLQALVKSGLRIENKKIVVAGSGALLLAVAEYLKSKGAKVLLVAEQTSRSKLLNFGLSLWKEPTKLLQAISLKAKLFGVRHLTDSYVISADGNDKLEAVNLTRNGKSWRVECDMLACGFHLVPNLELAAILGCDEENRYVSVNQFQETSIKGIYCAGEPTGIGGVEKSLIEGEIAGLSAIGEYEKAEKLFSKRHKAQKFAEALNETFRLRKELKDLPDLKTIVCRCEDVKFGEIKDHSSFRSAKLQTRCGMGACQSRICGSACEFLFDWKNESVRPPIFPVKLENLVD